MEQTINPAALLGTSVRRHHCSKLDFEFSLYAQGARYDKLCGHVTSTQPALIAALYAHDGKQQAHPTKYFSFNDCPYEEVLELAEIVGRHGHTLEHPLIDAQVGSRIAGFVLPEHVQAFKEFEADADAVLTLVHELKLDEFKSAKALRTVTAPRRARALKYRAHGVHVWPDEFDARYVRVACFSLPDKSVRAVRDVAYDFYESRGKRPLFTAT